MRRAENYLLPIILDSSPAYDTEGRLIGRDLSDGGNFRLERRRGGYTLHIRYANGEMSVDTHCSSLAHAYIVASYSIRTRWRRMYPVLQRPNRKTDAWCRRDKQS